MICGIRPRNTPRCIWDMFLGLIPHIMKRHPIEQMRPGDVFCGNDAYEGGGTHLPDIVLAEPVFVDGEMTFWAVNLAHHADFADRGHAHIYQEGSAYPADSPVPRGRIANRCARIDPAELSGATRAAFRFSRPDGRQSTGRRTAALRYAPNTAATRARGGRGVAGLRGAQNARGHRGDPRRNLQFRRHL